MASVFSQDYPHKELIVVDDGSTDGLTNDYLTNYFPDDLFFFFSINNSGVSEARNFGYRKSCGDLIIFLDSDDELLPGSIQERVSIFKNQPDIDLVFNDCLMGNVLEPQSVSVSAPCRGVNNYLQALLELDMSFNSPSSVIVHRRLIKKIGLFDKTLTISADLDFWIRAAYNGRVFHLPRPLTFYRIHAGQMHESKDAYRKDMYVLIKKHLNDQSVLSLSAVNFRRALAAFYLTIFLSTCKEEFSIARVHYYFFSLRSFFASPSYFCRRMVRRLLGGSSKAR